MTTLPSIETGFELNPTRIPLRSMPVTTLPLMRVSASWFET
jgi:hypothetical protein